MDTASIIMVIIVQKLGIKKAAPMKDARLSRFMVEQYRLILVMVTNSLIMMKHILVALP